MTQIEAAAREARRLLLACYDGVLATISVAVPGYPFGSVVPFCLDRRGLPVILIADIAQHRKNVVADSKVSLTVFDRGADDLQTNGRLTLIGDAARVAADDVDTAARYYRYFPEARDYHLTHGFEFWRLHLVRSRYIGGFGAIHWIEPDRLLGPNPFSAADESAMIAHMNADHVDTMREYLAHMPGTDAAVSTPTLAGVDADGIHLRTARRVWRLEFLARVSTPDAVRKALVGMARAARA